MSKRTASTRSRDTNTSGSQKKAKGGDTRSKKSLDFLYDDTPYDALLNGYSQEQLKELQEKLKEVQLEAIRSLDYESGIREVIGAKLDGKSMWFCVKWEGGETSFIPSNIIQRIAPNKVIEYYESIVQFSPLNQQNENNIENNNENNNNNDEKEKLVKVKEEKKDEEKKEEIIGLENLNRSIINGNGDALIDSQVVVLLGRIEVTEDRPIKQKEKENREKEKNRDSQKSNKNAKVMKTIHCTGCGVKLQFPTGTKLIKCPSCHHIMQTIGI